MKRIRKLYYTPAAILTLIAAMLLPGLLSAEKSRNKAKDPEAVAKSRYYTRQGYKYDSTATSFELYRHAYRLDPSNYEAKYNHGIHRIILGKDSAELEKARGMIRDYVDHYPADIDEASMYAMISSEILGDPDEAARVLERLLTIYPSRSDILNTLTRIYVNSSRFDDGLTTLRRYEHMEGMDANTVNTKVGIFIHKADTLAAFAAVDSLIAARPKDVEAWTLKGNLFNFYNIKDSALNSLRKAEALAPYSFQPKMALSQFFQHEGDSVRADELMTQALATGDLSVDEKSEGVMDFIKSLMSSGGDASRAFPMIETLLQQEPGNKSVLAIKAALENQLKMYDALYGTLRILLNEESTNPNLWGQLMLAHINANDLKEVPAIYEEAQKAIKEPNPNLDVYLASAYLMDKQPEKSVEGMLKAVKFYLPSYSDTIAPSVIADTVQGRNYSPQAMANLMQMLGDSYVSLKDTVRAFRIYDQVLTMDPNNVLALNNYAYFLALEKRDLDKALEMSRKAVDSDPENGTYLDTYAYILFCKGEYERACSFQEMAIEQTDEADASADLYDHYGNILWFLDKPKLAVENWKKALQKEPDNALIKKKVEDGMYYEK